MAVDRYKDGSISIKSNNGLTVISKIIGESNDKQEERFRLWVEDCAKLVTACPHTIKETEQYFLDNCDAVLIEAKDRRMKSFQSNVIMNYCKDKLEHQAPEFSFDMSDEEMEKWRKEENSMRQEAMNSSPEQFGLNIRGYCLPHTERNLIFYEEAYQEAQKSMKHSNNKLKQIEMQDICFFFEETTGHCQSSGGGRSLMNQLIAFMGVGEEDIKKRSARFLGYISALSEMGDLPRLDTLDT
ncbi:hypothetical protein [Clostridium polynesiense]|uniref:hypothetical protein n=1 Tax=Clostridium polynesiense TaxID=1325933 RepID=UPI00058D4FFB|nr:hypothetical protein [Clostridium polynesiense]